MLYTLVITFRFESGLVTYVRRGVTGFSFKLEEKTFTCHYGSTYPVESFEEPYFGEIVSVVLTEEK